MDAGTRTETDPAATVRQLRLDADSGVPKACFDLGRCYTEGTPPLTKDVALGMQWLEKSADAGLGDGQCQVGMMYMTGDGVAKDCERGMSYLRLAAEQDMPIAQHLLAECYTSGQGGVPQDYVEAARWLRRAADSGFAESQWMLSAYAHKTRLGASSAHA